MRRLAPEPPAGTRGPQADPEQVARTILLRRLERGPRTRAELARTLTERGVPDEVSVVVLDRFEQVDLIDDARFARAWVESRMGSRGLAPRALRSELLRRGVEPEVITEALAEVGASDELEAAERVARRRAGALAALPRPVAERRLAGALARRGHSPSVVMAVVRRVLDEFEEESPT